MKKKTNQLNALAILSISKIILLKNRKNFEFIEINFPKKKLIKILFQYVLFCRRELESSWSSRGEGPAKRRRIQEAGKQQQTKNKQNKSVK